jgi:hypothetical protein
MIETGKSPIHWNYFLALEADLVEVARYIEFAQPNFPTYSVELAHLLLAAGSEVDVVLKEICIHFDARTTAATIDAYRTVISERLAGFIDETVHVFRFKLRLHPWADWKTEVSPDWWWSYNKVKHERSKYFCEANLRNVLNAMAALLVAVHYFYKLTWHGPEFAPLDDQQVSLVLKPNSQLLSFPSTYYYDQSHLPVG